MDDHREISLDAETSPAFGYAIRCLAGKRHWEGVASSFWGLYRRAFSIISNGRVQASKLLFDEKIEFADGEVQDRSWQLIDSARGVLLQTDNAKLKKPGALENGVFEIVYDLKIAGVWVAYVDQFKIDDQGNVENWGFMKLFGITIMAIKVYSPVTG
ncbi:DUF3833 family protein [Hyphococcus sp. DH-69]|uniref:DUF3833 family protein n=1 Tax=Hyphococcus formosus TaxID=3143534 RepID=UPI00398B9CD5